jgi:acyl-homoserine lactone acylase PvdQ
MRPIPGNTSQNDWSGIHPFEDLVQITNPPQGYMQNCNVSPQFLMKDCPLRPSPEAPYLFNGFNGFDDLEHAYDNPLHQRAAMCVDLLHNARDMTVEDAIQIATSPDVFGADQWQQRLEQAWSSASADVRTDRDLTELYELIANWNGRCEAGSTGAIAYKYWKDAFGKDIERADRAGLPPPAELPDQALLAKLKEAGDKLRADFGRVDVAYGDVYRVGRRGAKETWPVGGGSVAHLATPRAISFEPIEDTKQLRGRGGQTSTQIVLLTKPPKSWTVLPLGESDRADSPHFDDQARRLFSKGTMKPTYFLDKPELVKHVESKTVLDWHGN